MTISLADNSPRDEYTLGAGATQQVFTVSFEFFDDTDLSVYVDGVEKTLGTASTTAQYVTANTTATGSDRVVHVSGTDGFIQFGAELTGASGGSKIVITRDIALSRTTDFPTSGPFDVTTLNTELDKFIAISADLKDQASRALQLTDFDAAASLTLPALADRKGKVLAFNSSSGAVEAGPTITATQTVAAQAADIDALAGIAANLTTVAGIASNVTAVAAKSSLITSDFVSDLNALAVSDVISDINVLATSDIVSDLNTLGTSDFVSDLNALAAIASDITAAADVSSSIAASGTNATAAANSATAAANSATAAASSASSLTAGISANNILQADTGLADDDFLRIKGTKIEGRSAAELVSDIGAITASSSATLTNKSIAATQLTGALPAISGANLTGIAAGATGGGSDQIFYENGQAVTTDYTITNGKNAMSAGPITVNSGVTITVGSGETYTVV